LPSLGGADQSTVRVFHGGRGHRVRCPQPPYPWHVR
jgi:hypothetical protein